MSVYNKYTGTQYETTSSLLILTQSTPYVFTNNYVYTDLSNNVNFKISPKIIRDAIISIWDTTTFKTTTINNIDYIGLDSGDVTNQYLKKKIHFGKRLFKTTDIMSSSLLSSNSDIYFYNTKLDTGLNQITRLSFLSGNNSSNFSYAPYIESYFVTATPSNYLSLNIQNKGDINFLSQTRDFSTGFDTTNTYGTVSLNDISFPPYNNSSNSKNKILKYDKNLGYLNWWDPQITQNGIYGTADSIMEIYGKPVLINGVNIEIDDSRMVPIEIGDIKMGTTFSSDSIYDVLNRIIYTYTPPLCSLKLNTPKYLEVGTYQDISLTYKIYKNTKDLLPTKLINMSPSQVPSIGGEGRITAEGDVKGFVVQPITQTSSVFTLKVDDGFSSNIATQTVTGVYPYYYGFLDKSNLRLETVDINNLKKVVDYTNTNKINLSGSGYFYYIQDKNYQPVSGIYDPNNPTKNIIKNYTRIAQQLSSPEGTWQYKDYYVYKSKNILQINPPSQKYSFVTGIVDDSSLKILLDSKNYKGGLTWSNSKGPSYSAIFTSQPSYTKDYISLTQSGSLCSINDFIGITKDKFTFNVVVKNNYDYENYPKRDHNTIYTSVWTAHPLFTLSNPFPNQTLYRVFNFYSMIQYSPPYVVPYFYIQHNRMDGSNSATMSKNGWYTNDRNYNPNSIQQYTLTIDGPSYSFYLNGYLVATDSSATYSNKLSSTFSKINIGFDGSNRMFGDYYHFSLYDRVLLDDEILRNYMALKDEYEKLDGIYYYGKLTKSEKDPITINNLLELKTGIENRLDKNVTFGTGSIYYISSVDNSPVSGIYRFVGSTSVNIISTFSRVVQELPSIDGYWKPKDHYIYNWNSNYTSAVNELRFSHGVVTSSMSLYIDPMKSIDTSNNIIYDMSGNGYHGQIKGDYLYDNRSLSFNGYNSFIDFGKTTPKLYPGTSSFAWDGWLKFGPYTGRFRDVWFGNASGGITGFGLLLNHNTNHLRIEFCRANPLKDQPNIREVKYLPVDKYLNKWFHLSLSFDSNLINGFKTMRCYINGGTSSYVGDYTSFTYSSAAEAIQRPNTSLMIGSHGATDLYYDGSLSDIKFYSRTLNEGEILQNYYATKDRFGL